MTNNHVVENADILVIVFQDGSEALAVVKVDQLPESARSLPMGDSNEVELRTPPLSDLMWLQWRYKGPVQAGSHAARIRAYVGNGELQVTEQSSSHPNGATGIHTYSFDV